MLRYFKRFADFVNQYRIKFDFKSDLNDFIKSYKNKQIKVLEIGCNISPTIDKKLYNNIKLYGIDPDKSIDKINMIEHKIFDQFDICSIDNYQTENKFDLIVMNMVFEHIENNDHTLQKVEYLLKSDGILVSQHPSNLHPYSLLNRMLNHNLKIMVIKLLRPWSAVGKITGWKSYYDKCNIISLNNCCIKNNLKIWKGKFFWNGSDYFAFCPPIFLLIVFYEELCRILNIKLLCSHCIIYIKKSKLG
jgi:SAM-dependent methyltransferase